MIMGGDDFSSILIAAQGGMTEQSVAVLSGGDGFGELALIQEVCRSSEQSNTGSYVDGLPQGGRRTATCTALDEVQVWPY